MWHRDTKIFSKTEHFKHKGIYVDKFISGKLPLSNQDGSFMM